MRSRKAYSSCTLSPNAIFNEILKYNNQFYASTNTSLLGWCGNGDGPGVGGNNSERTGVWTGVRTGVGFDFVLVVFAQVLEQRFSFQSQLDLAQMDTDVLDCKHLMVL